MKPKQVKRLHRQEELLQEFSHQDIDHYEERQVGSEWFIKSWNRGTGRWQVSIYSNESYRRYKSFNERQKDFDYVVNKD